VTARGGGAAAATLRRGETGSGEIMQVIE